MNHTTTKREPDLTPAPDIAFASKVATLVRAAKELGRALVFPLRAAFYLPRARIWRRRAVLLLEQAAHIDPRDQDRRNDDARRRFRARLPDQPLRRILIACGEHSGEGHACALVDQLRDALPEVEISGIGGRTLEARGVVLLANIVDAAVMGLRGVLAQLPLYVRLVARYIDHLCRQRPDLVVLVDNPGLNMILATEARRRGIPVLYYICPQYWAWAPWRLNRFRRNVHGAIAILPFERPMFEGQGIPTAFAGNPLRTRAPVPAPEPREPILALLPGSRKAEIARNLPALLHLHERFRERHPDARSIIPQENPRHRERIAAVLAAERQRGRALPGLDVQEVPLFDLLARARAAVVKSGTSALQTALCRTPQVIYYSLTSAAQGWLARHYLTVPWVGGPNLVLGRCAVPEFLVRGAADWDAILARLLELWDDGPTRATQLAAADEVRTRVDGPGAAQEAVRWLTKVP